MALGRGCLRNLAVSRLHPLSRVHFDRSAYHSGQIPFGHHIPCRYILIFDFLSLGLSHCLLPEMANSIQSSIADYRLLASASTDLWDHDIRVATDWRGIGANVRDILRRLL